MAEPVEVQPVKGFIAVLWAHQSGFDNACRIAIERWGSIDYVGRARPFDRTDYYMAEMGAPLFRTIVTFERLVSPEWLANAKLACNDIEHQQAIAGRRTTNLDVGYLDHNKIVLASVKYAGQKIYLSKGIYADLIARYRDGRYQPFEWTFPDFRDGRYDDDLSTIRHRYLQQLREQSAFQRRSDA